MDSHGEQLLRQWFKKTGLVDHQIRTFNYFITCGLPTIVRKESPVETEHYKIYFDHAYVDSPKFINLDRTTSVIYPNDARVRNINYEGTLFATVRVLNNQTGQTHVYNQIPLGKMPIMIKSNACNLLKTQSRQMDECNVDPGGYFIIKGKERVLIGQLRRAYNKVYVEYCPDDRYKYLAELRSMNIQGASVLIQLKLNVDIWSLYFSLPYIKTKSLIPAGVVFRALDIALDHVLSYAWMNVLADQEPASFIKQSLMDQYNMYESHEEALESIANDIGDDKKREDFIKDIFNRDLFYHIGELNHEYSALHLGYMIKKMVETVCHGRVPDDKYNLANKRLDSTSSLLTFIFQILFKQAVKTIVTHVDDKKKSDPIHVIKNLKNITYGLNHSFLTGNWNTQKSSLYTRIGVSQVVSMQNYGAKLSHLRRIMLPIGKKGKNAQMRHLHSSHFSFLCPYETPEGDTVGIVLNLALSTVISTPDNLVLLEDTLRHFKTFSASFEEINSGSTLIILNGKIIGTCTKAYTFKQEFETYRQSDLISSMTSIVHLPQEKEIHIESDEGRFLRPLFNLKKNCPLYSEYPLDWDTLVKHQAIVFRDCWELEQSVVAMNRDQLKKHKCHFLEMAPSYTMMGVMASVIPLANHSQSPRNAYQASMGKQAIGMPCLNYKQRYDTSLNVLDSPQKPLACSRLVSALNFDVMSHGCNPIIAVMTFQGFNQEDSIILNRSSLQRGLFSATTFKTIVEEEKKRGNSDFEIICLPQFKYRNKNYDYTHLDEHGLISCRKDVWLTKNTVIIGRVNNKMVKKENGSRMSETVDTSIVIKQGEEGYLDHVLSTFNNEGIRVIHIRLRIPRPVEIGDKFASCTAQKGTCGMIYNQEDLPFTKEGLVPDLIINPHAIPSRMTINMLIEMAFNLVQCYTGKQMDTTTFHHMSLEDTLTQWRQRLGLTSYSTTMFDGITGQVFPSKIFIAPCFYQRLKHMVVEKIHARVAGPLDTLTHQPVAGRSRDGGLRFGEMEKDCMLGHGSTRILKEALFDKSDKYFIPMCTECGTTPNKRDYCTQCGTTNIELKNMPYATKLLLQELSGMGVKIKIS